MPYVIQFTGHVSQEGQFNGLPEKIFSFLIFDGDDSAAINSIIETQAAAIVRAQAMFTQQEQGKIIDLRQTPTERMLVPMCWIVKLVVDVKPMTGELSQADEKGIERLKDGTEPTKQ